MAGSLLNDKTKSKKAVKEDGNAHVRKMRRFFCVCTILFTMNSKCSFPIHTFIADAIQTCQGSKRLLRLLNRFGVCASADTHARYVQHRVEKVKEEGPMTGYTDNTFSVVSVDNIDYVHSFANLYCGKQDYSWHGTTVQVVQPQPKTLLDGSVTQTATLAMPLPTSTCHQGTHSIHHLKRGFVPP